MDDYWDSYFTLGYWSCNEGGRRTHSSIAYSSLGCIHISNAEKSKVIEQIEYISTKHIHIPAYKWRIPPKRSIPIVLEENFENLALLIQAQSK